MFEMSNFSYTFACIYDFIAYKIT